MKLTMKAMLAATCLVAGMAVTSYAGSVSVEGDIQAQEPGEPDKYDLKCSETGNICAQVCDIGPFDDNLFEVEVTCKNTGEEVEATAPGGACAVVCVSDCQRANVEVECDEESEFCDDDYSLEIECEGDVVQFKQDQDT